ncbi:MAG: nitroreductase family protein [Candidatus Coatesbacteria bacterium]
MTVFEAIRRRRSIRKYRDRKIPAAALRRVLEAARLAPSANNQQAWRFIVVRDRAKLRKIARACRWGSFVDQAPVALVFCGTDGRGVMTNGQRAATVDVTIAMSYVTLAATELGLGTCWLASYREAPVKRLLGIPRKATVVGITPLGYPAEHPGPRPRKKPGEVVRLDRW